MATKRKCGPNSYPNWKHGHHTGKQVTGYVTNGVERRKARNERKRTLCLKGQQLTEKCGGEIFIMYRDENDKTAIYTSSDEMFNQYMSDGLHLHQEMNVVRLDDTGKEKEHLKIVTESETVPNAAESTPPAPNYVGSTPAVPRSPINATVSTIAQTVQDDCNTILAALNNTEYVIDIKSASNDTLEVLARGGTLKNADATPDSDDCYSVISASP